MTYEQKPESAEFRLIGEQAANFAHWVRDEGDDFHKVLARVGQELRIAEARGAAEQRRKDAEGSVPVGWVDPDDLAFLEQKWEYYVVHLHTSQSAKAVFPLYARPANVTALEARVKELEGVLRNVRDAIEKSDPKVLVCTLWMTWPSETVVDYISAAIREGGEHG